MLRILLRRSKSFTGKPCGHQVFILRLYHTDEISEGLQLWELYRRTYPKVLKLSEILKDVNLINGTLINIQDDSVITDESICKEMQTFMALARSFIGSPASQQGLGNSCFAKPDQREPLVLSSLTRVSDFLNVSAQQRQKVRLTICPQITQHHIWKGALKEILMNLKTEMGSLKHDHPSAELQMGKQIVSSCLKFLESLTRNSNSESSSWMKLDTKKTADGQLSQKWGDLLEMFNDLMKCLKCEGKLVYHVSKLEAMKEGLYQIKDVLAERDIGYKETRHQEHLVLKKLTKQLGHSSKCLFTLLLYYLYGSVGDVEVDVCGGIDSEGGKLCLCIGKILTSDNEKMVYSGIKQLDQALGLFKFVWETAGMKGQLALEGHLWCVNAKEKKVTYRGNMFFLHGIRI